MNHLRKYGIISYGTSINGLDILQLFFTSEAKRKEFEEWLEQRVWME